MSRTPGARNKRPALRNRTLSNPSVQLGQFDGAIAELEEVFALMTTDPVPAEPGKVTWKPKPVVVMIEADALRVNKAIAQLQELRRALFREVDDEE